MSGKSNEIKRLLDILMSQYQRRHNRKYHCDWGEHRRAYFLSNVSMFSQQSHSDI